ncbi:MAG: lytic transglycosylase domain-containing protein [Lachnospiraceae bacterium]|nr:lytic transglycosylase domain-containing protein [Lachnospiraceae bacterium]
MSMIHTVDYYRVNSLQTNTETKATAEAAQAAGFASVLGTSTQTEVKETTAASVDDIFLKASETYQVPVNLIKAVAKTESNFDPNAVSCCGAQGVMQLMPSTAAGLGVTNPFDAEQNIMGGTKYLSQMMDLYDGDVKLALAAYNAGAGNVAKYGGVPPFKETQAYVERVMEYMGEDLDAPLYQTKAVQEQNLVFTVRESDKNYTYEDYSRFMDIFREQLTLSQLDKMYKTFLNQ